MVIGFFQVFLTINFNLFPIKLQFKTFLWKKKIQKAYFRLKKTLMNTNSATIISALIPPNVSILFYSNVIYVWFILNFNNVFFNFITLIFQLIIFVSIKKPSRTFLIFSHNISSTSASVIHQFLIFKSFIDWW